MTADGVAGASFGSITGPRPSEELAAEPVTLCGCLGKNTNTNAPTNNARTITVTDLEVELDEKDAVVEVLPPPPFTGAFNPALSVASRGL
jgi:hypothetical protein